jgi:fumarylacetoacetate (FAA) hydrolase
MKLATLKDGTRDGKLVVVSCDLTRATEAFNIAPTLQKALDDWERLLPKLIDLAEGLEHGSVPSFRFHEHDCMSPLPRAYQWADGSAYVNHVELVRKARGAEMPESFWTDPLMYQGGSDSFLGPRDPIRMADEAWGIDMEAEVAVVTGDVPIGVTAQDARRLIRLVMLVNDVSLRSLIPAELSKGFGFFQSKPSSAFSPVAVTPDELGDAWDGGKVRLPLHVDLNGKPFGRADAGEDMTFDFGRLIAHAAKTRPLAAGSIIGSGTVSNKDADGGSGKPVDQGGRGYSCIAELRMIETIRSGQPSTPFLRFGDQLRIEMLDRNGRSIFGAIEQVVENFALAPRKRGEGGTRRKAPGG